jgi:hypothetical protein
VTAWRDLHQCACGMAHWSLEAVSIHLLKVRFLATATGESGAQANEALTPLVRYIAPSIITVHRVHERNDASLIRSST